MGAFLDDLPGIRDLQWEDTAPVPRRNRIAFVGAVSVTDNPSRGTTDIVFNAPTPAGDTASFTLPSGSVGAWGNPQTFGDAVRTVSLCRWLPTAAYEMSGIAPELPSRFVAVHAGSAHNIVLRHQSPTVDAQHRFNCPGKTNFILTPGTMIELVRDTATPCWWVVP